jgi:sugar lactone lactonase YvrE
MSLRYLAITLLTAAPWVACSNNPPVDPASDSGIRPDPGAIRDAGFDDDGGVADSGLPEVERGPVMMPVDGDPNGLYWDSDEPALYLADDNMNRILKWTDEAGISVVTTLPAAPAQGPGLGQVVRLEDGTLVVPRFGYGTQGDIVVVRPGQAATTIAGLDVTRRRIGLGAGGGQALYGTFFVNAAGNRVGSITRIDLTAGTEVELITGLQKPVGVLLVGDTLFYSDQDRRQIYSAPIANPTAGTLYATLDSVDLLSVGPDGSFFTGSKTGQVFKVAAGGAVSIMVAGLQEVRGTAYDAVNRRLFIADHDGDPSDGSLNYLHIVPVD